MTLHIISVVLCFLWSLILSIITIAFIVTSCGTHHHFLLLLAQYHLTDSAISDFPIALLVGLNEIVFMTLVAASTLGAVGVLRRNIGTIQIFNKVIICHLPVNVCAGIALLILIFGASLEARLRAAAVTLLIIGWVLETTLWTLWYYTEELVNKFSRGAGRHRDIHDFEYQRCFSSIRGSRCTAGRITRVIHCQRYNFPIWNSRGGGNAKSRRDGGGSGRIKSCRAECGTVTMSRAVSRRLLRLEIRFARSPEIDAPLSGDNFAIVEVLAGPAFLPNLSTLIINGWTPSQLQYEKLVATLSARLLRLKVCRLVMYKTTRHNRRRPDLKPDPEIITALRKLVAAGMEIHIGREGRNWVQ
ncbi:hypothetical protein B0H13DRAFT_1851205 [Mycena leptocephala]|nr:hypothetical protein B0H13DRAFT_1851205 [Mycena leptocephala]